MTPFPLFATNHRTVVHSRAPRDYHPITISGFIAQDALELGLVGLLSRPVLNAVFPKASENPLTSDTYLDDKNKDRTKIGSEEPIDEIANDSTTSGTAQRGNVTGFVPRLRTSSTSTASSATSIYSDVVDMPPVATQTQEGAPHNNRDTFGPGDVGSPDMNALAERTNTITVVDGMPVSKTIGLDKPTTTKDKSITADKDNKPVNGLGINGVNGVNGTAKDVDTSLPPLSVPILAVTNPEGTVAVASDRPVESPALFMPGGARPLNFPVPDDGVNEPLPKRTSRSYVAAQPVIETHYDRPLDDVPLSPPTKKTELEGAAVAAGAKRPARAPRTSSRKKDIPTQATQATQGRKENQDQELAREVPKEKKEEAVNSPPLPTVVAIPVPVPNPAPSVPPSVHAPIEEADDLDNYDRVRASFYSVPDPTRPETAQAYREEISTPRHNDESMASVDVNAPESTASPMGSPSTPFKSTVPVPVPIAANGHAQQQQTQQQHPQQQQLQQQQQQQADQPRRRSLRHSVQGMTISEPVPIKVYDHDAAQAKRRASTRSQGDVPGQLSASNSTSKRSSHARPQSPPVSGPHGQSLPPIRDGVMVGEVLPFSRQQQLQTTGSGTHTPPRHQLVDHGVVTPPGGAQRSTGAGVDRRQSFGYRPQPVLIEDHHVPGRDTEAGFFAPDHRTQLIGRSNTTHSRATTLGRNGTLSRASNGGTVGRRAGGFGMGAGLSVGTQPEEVLGREDIHSRADRSERQLDKTTLHRLSRLEKKDARKLEKLMKEEEREQARAVEQSIRDLKSLTNMQKEALSNERKSQQRLARWTAREHKARMRFLKEKERYEKVEAELRNAENDFEERRDHAAGLTAQVAERTQEIDDLRAQKAVDDRERRVKIHAMRNPAYA